MDVDELIAQARNLFHRSYGKLNASDIIVSIAPGRVNLIGEHTDYNDGFVLPMAIEKSTVCVAARSDVQNRCRITSAQQGSKIYTFNADKYLKSGETNWTKFVQGVVAQYLSSDLKEIGFDAALVSNVPIGGGLSSSASLDISIAAAVEKLFNIKNVTGMERVLKCVHSNHTFVNVPCGIMDQAASNLCQKNALLLLDCRSQKTSNIKFLPEDNFSIIVCNSNSPHKHTDGGYEARVLTCQKGVRILDSLLNREINSLRDVTIEDFLSVEANIKDDTVRKRVRHVITENTRVLQVVQLLNEMEKGADVARLKTLGDILYESHRSLKDDYEVSTKELDYLVEISRSIDGVVGSRMTGGGFGGCTVTVVHKSASNQLQAELRKRYKNRFKKECTIFETSPSEDFRKLAGKRVGNGVSQIVLSASTVYLRSTIEIGKGTIQSMSLPPANSPKKSMKLDREERDDEENTKTTPVTEFSISAGGFDNMAVLAHDIDSDNKETLSETSAKQRRLSKKVSNQPSGGTVEDIQEDEPPPPNNRKKAIFVVPLSDPKKKSIEPRSRRQAKRSSVTNQELAEAGATFISSAKNLISALRVSLKDPQIRREIGQTISTILKEDI